MLETGHKTGILTLDTTAGQGTFSICDGQIVEAKFNEKCGEEAVYATFMGNTGTFTFSPQEMTGENPEISVNTTFLLMEGCRRLDEAAIPDSPLDQTQA